MLNLGPTLSQISQVMLQATAPAFLLGATASFIGILVTRLNVIIDRSRSIHGIKEGDPDRAHLRADLPRLKRRALLLQRALTFAVASAICTTFLILWAFAAAFLAFNHLLGAALVFMTSLFLFCAALLILAQEVRIGLVDLDHLP